MTSGKGQSSTNLGVGGQVVGGEFHDEARELVLDGLEALVLVLSAEVDDHHPGTVGGVGKLTPTLFGAEEPLRLPEIIDERKG